MAEDRDLVVRDFSRRCTSYGVTAVVLVAVWALTRLGWGVVHVQWTKYHHSIRIGPSFWPMWPLLFGALNIAKRARRTFGT